MTLQRTFLQSRGSVYAVEYMVWNSSYYAVIGVKCVEAWEPIAALCGCRVPSGTRSSEGLAVAGASVKHNCINPPPGACTK